MRALTEKQQLFVLAMLADPFGTQAKWARTAGYSDKSEAAKVKGSILVHDPKIAAAVAEVSRGQLNIVGPMLATQGLIRIARNPKHPKHLRAVEMLANRTGFHEKTEHHVVVDHAGGGALDRIRAAAALLGVDPAQLLGANTPMKLIEHEPAEKTV